MKENVAPNDEHLLMAEIVDTQKIRNQNTSQTKWVGEHDIHSVWAGLLSIWKDKQLADWGMGKRKGGINSHKDHLEWIEFGIAEPIPKEVIGTIVQKLFEELHPARIDGTQSGIELVNFLAYFVASGYFPPPSYASQWISRSNIIYKRTSVS